MRNISFALTTEQFLDGTKDVTRRNGWLFLKTGDLLCAVEKSQGLKRGETVKRLGRIRVVSVRREPLNAITQDDCNREGFPHFTPEQFVAFYAKHNKCAEDALITRIEFVTETRLCTACDKGRVYRGFNGIGEPYTSACRVCDGNGIVMLGGAE